MRKYSLSVAVLALTQAACSATPDGARAGVGDAGSSSGGGTGTGAQAGTTGSPSGGSGGTPATGGSGGTTMSGGAAGSGGADPNAGCPHAGSVMYTFNGEDAWPADVVELLTAAMDEAVRYYNCYSDLSHELTVNYDEGVPTAQANVDGWMTFGGNRGYMVVATAMHEIGHTMGVGYYPWQELMDNGRWVGAATVQLISSLPPEERDPDEYSQRDYITGDSQHFWPYGLNQASEHQSEWSLINHVRLVAAMNEDKASYLAGQ